MKLSKEYIILLLIILVSSLDMQPLSTYTKKMLADTTSRVTSTPKSEQISIDNHQQPLIFILKQKQHFRVIENEIKATFSIGDKQVSCIFRQYNQLCYLSAVVSSTLNFNLTCSTLPCEIGWKLIQMDINENASGKYLTDRMIAIEKQKAIIIMLKCNDGEIQTLKPYVKSYSQSKFTEGSESKTLYYLFQKHHTSRHLYIQVTSEAKTCQDLQIYSIPDQIAKGQQIKTFIKPLKAKSLSFDNPQEQFWLECTLHSLNNKNMNDKLIIQMYSNDQKITSHHIKIHNHGKVYDFNLAFPAISSSHTSLQLRLKSKKKTLILSLSLNSGTTVLPQNTHSYFSFPNNSIINYKLEKPQQNSDQSLPIEINSKNQVNSSITKCPTHEQCQFNIQYSGSQQSGNGHVIVGQLDKDQVFYINLDSKVQRKINGEDTMYFRKSIKKENNAFQILVNNVNVILYGALQHICETPGENCNQRIGNSQHPLIYQPSTSGEFIVAAKALDDCEFTISVVQDGQKYIKLSENQSFSYLMGKDEEEIVFDIAITKDQGINLNLISPLNRLILVATTQDRVPDPQTDIIGVDGYLKLSSGELKNNNHIKVMVTKVQDFQDTLIHFTLIATSLNSSLKLQKGVTHYDQIGSQDSLHYSFQFEEDEDYILNIHAYNHPSSTFNLTLTLSHTFHPISTQSKVINITEPTSSKNLRQYSQLICQQSGEMECQVFIEIVNPMEVEADLIILLLMKNSKLQLKDGLWQTYQISSIAETMNYYFNAPFKNQSINIVFSSKLIELGIIYSLWQSEETSYNPEQWPFPEKPTSQELTSNNTNKYIFIDKESLVKCWPHCIVLICIFQKQTPSNKNFFELAPQYLGNFSIMASSHLIELPEKTKLSLSLQENEQKYIMVDLKHSMEKQILTFFTSTVIGYYYLYAMVYSDQHRRCPIDFREYDFDFGETETQIKVSSIKKKIEENNLQEDTGYYLCILANCQQPSRFQIQFTSEETYMKILYLNSNQQITLNNSAKFYQIGDQSDFQVKIIKNDGSYYLKTALCDRKDDDTYESCLDAVTEQQDKGSLILNKTYLFSQKVCDKCITFIKLKSELTASLTLRVESPEYSVTELKENHPVFDFTEKDKINRYDATIIREQQTIINVQVFQGSPLIKVEGPEGFEAEKQKQKQKNSIRIMIPKGNKEKSEGSKTFVMMSIAITSKSGEYVGYTISYSSGQPLLYLQNGLIMGYVLQKNEPVDFLYKNNQIDKKAYLSISMQKSFLSQLQIQISIVNDQNNLDEAKSVSLNMLELKKKLPHSTITYELPSTNLTKIQLQSSVQAKVSLIVNHQQIMVLPLQLEFNFKTEKDEIMNFYSDISSFGNYQLTIRKCREQLGSSVSYTQDEESFKDNDFDFTEGLENKPMSTFYIKIKKDNRIYLQIKGGPSDGIFSIKLSWLGSKKNYKTIYPGNSGIIQYKLLDFSKALVTFNKVQCQTQCDSSITYQWMADPKLDNVYLQTVCPTSYFEDLSVKPIQFKVIQSHNTKPGLLAFQYTLLEQHSYIMVKAITQQGQLYYQPLQVMSWWNSITTKNKKTLHISSIFFSIFLCILLMIVVRRVMKKGKQYQTLPDHYSQV